MCKKEKYEKHRNVLVFFFASAMLVILNSQKLSLRTSSRSAFVFGTMCSTCAERDVHFVRDVAFGSDVRFAREDAEHITSLCAAGAIHHYGEAIASLRRSRYITLYKRS